MDEENSLEKLINKDQLELIKQYIDQEVEKKCNIGEIILGETDPGVIGGIWIETI